MHKTLESLYGKYTDSMWLYLFYKNFIFSVYWRIYCGDEISLFKRVLYYGQFSDSINLILHSKETTSYSRSSNLYKETGVIRTKDVLLKFVMTSKRDTSNH